MAHGLLVTAHCLPSDPEPYADLAAGYFDQPQSPGRQAERMVRKLQHPGHTVELKLRAA